MAIAARGVGVTPKNAQCPAKSRTPAKTSPTVPSTASAGVAMVSRAVAGGGGNMPAIM